MEKGFVNKLNNTRLLNINNTYSMKVKFKFLGQNLR